VWSEPRCVRARETLSAVLDGEASEADVLAALRHVRRCLGCRRFVAGVVATTRALRTARVIQMSSARQPR
jgi:predicted anti-sigma-YlaC factor YlaD